MIVADLVAVLLLAALVGVLASGRAGLCWSFAIYLGSALLTNRLVRWWPDRFYTTSFFSGKELFFAALTVVIVLELTWSGLASFPRARRLSGALALVVATAGTIGILRMDGASDYRTRIGILGTSGQLFALLALVAFLGVVQWYRLPLRPWHRAIILGFLLYRGIYGVLLATLGRYGGPSYAFVAELDRAAYAATVGLWTAAAWRPEWNDLRAQARLRAGAIQRS